MRSENAPCRGQPYTPSQKIPALASLFVELKDQHLAAAYAEDEADDADVDDNDRVDEDGYYIGEEDLTSHLN